VVELGACSANADVATRNCRYRWHGGHCRNTRHSGNSGYSGYSRDCGNATALERWHPRRCFRGFGRLRRFGPLRSFRSFRSFGYFSRFGWLRVTV